MSLTRRSVLGAGLTAGLAAGLAGCGRHAASGRAAAAGATTEPAAEVSAAGSPSVGPAPSSAPPPVAAGYVPKLTAALSKYLVPTAEIPKHPGYPGAVALVAVNGVTTAHVAVGDALRYGAGPVELPTAKRVAMRPDSVFDIASITKVFTSVLVLQQVERGAVDLAAPVEKYLPDFTGTGKSAVTVAMLLAHTSGLPVGASVTGLPDAAARWNRVMTTPLVAGAVPGATFRYSSVGMLVLGRLVEKVTGKPLDQAVRAGITGPLGMRTTGYLPTTWLSAADRAARLVATDARSSRGLLRGVVHDDVCNTLGGIAGHAGLFSTAADLALLGQALLNGGGHLLTDATVRRMLTNANPGLPAIDEERPTRTATHGLGVELDQPWFMGRLAAPTTFGHTGFTGTELVVDPRRKLVLVLLDNRAHPNWSWADPDPPRVAVANVLADALR